MKIVIKRGSILAFPMLSFDEGGRNLRIMGTEVKTKISPSIKVFKIF